MWFFCQCPECLLTERWGFFSVCCCAIFMVKVMVKTGQIQICLFLQYVLNCRSSHIHTGCDHYKSDCLVKRLDCCVPKQGHSDGLKLHWLFLSPTFFFYFFFNVRLSLCKETRCVDVLLWNKPTKYNLHLHAIMTVTLWLTVSRHTTGLFWQARWQTFFILDWNSHWKCNAQDR